PRVLSGTRDLRRAQAATARPRAGFFPRASRADAEVFDGAVARPSFRSARRARETAQPASARARTGNQTTAPSTTTPPPPPPPPPLLARPDGDLECAGESEAREPLTMAPVAEKATQTPASAFRRRRPPPPVAGDRGREAGGLAGAAAKGSGNTPDGTGERSRALDRSFPQGAVRTPAGSKVAHALTSDMISSIFRFGDRKRKSVFDLATLAVVAAHVALFAALPLPARKPTFFFLFCFWRLSYNVGLGVLLKYQSEHRGLVALAQRLNLFGRAGGSGSADGRARGPRPSPRVRRVLREELSSKMRADYDFDAVPVEFNTWLLFRALVDLVLMNDFTSYACFALSFVSSSPESGTLPVALRWITGLGLICFNLWVKVDAHRVVKDFAWCKADRRIAAPFRARSARCDHWGDFFFLIDADLTFDGVFEIYPHPMYS
ncbi:MAG: hypothetical protein BJ554DRAFT_1466, partial [Olpidium bornovanus]